MNITAVVVTHNRNHLLRQCLECIEAQTRHVDALVIVDNCSTDGTTAFLAAYAASRGNVHIIPMESNAGGAGGFEAGIKYAVEHGADYVWIMDDDTHPTPAALSKLLDTLDGNPRGGFAASRVEWTDGALHLMNIPLFPTKKLRSECPGARSPLPCRAATFVSLLVPARVIEKVGLPIGEFFIWHDDIEYTSRITGAGYDGVFVPASVAVHATAANRGATIEDAPAGTERRFYYQMRNYMATKRLHSNRVKAIIAGFLKYRRLRRAIRRRPDGQKLFLDEVKRGFHDGMTFHPAIKKVTPGNSPLIP